MRVFFDASVLIAGLLSPDGGSAQFIRYHKRGIVRGFTSQTVIDEVLSKTEKLKRSREELEDFIAQTGLIVYRRMSSDEIRSYKGWVDVEDAHLFAGARRIKCTHVISLDKKHVLRADVKAKAEPLRIVSPTEFLEKLVDR